MAHCFKAVSIDEATRLLAAAPQFEGWQRADTEAILQVLAERWVLRYTPVPSEVPWYRWPKAVYQVAREEALHAARNFLEELPLYNTPDESVPRLYTERTVEVPKRFARLVVHRRQNSRVGLQPSLHDPRQEDVPCS